MAFVIENVLEGNMAEINSLLGELSNLRRQVDHATALTDMMATDLNTPLTLLSGYLEIVRDHASTTADPALQEYLQIMQHCVDRIMQAVKDLNDVTLAEAQALQLSLRPTNVESWLRTSMQECRARLHSRGQRLTLNHDPAVISIICDDNRLTQVLQNLCAYLSEHCVSGSMITLTLSTLDDARKVKVAIAAESVTMPYDQVSQILGSEPGLLPVSERGQGVGLGLYVAHLLTRLHGAQIEVMTDESRVAFYFVVDATPGDATLFVPR